MSIEGTKELPRLLAPRADMSLLLWPEPRQMLRQTWENHRQLRGGGSARFLDVPVAQVRGWMRRWLGHAHDQTPLIATGHQAELHHPGVWVKNVVIHAAAERIGAKSIHFAVDTDAPKHLVYRWPAAARPITDDPNLARCRWSGLVKAPTAEHLDRLVGEMADAAKSWGYAPANDVFFVEMKRYAGGARSLPYAMTEAQRAGDNALGLANQTVIASEFSRTNGYLLFVYDICSRADEYAAAYNAALAEYRAENGIVSPGRPMPDLAIEDEFCEVPFWIDDLADGSRRRATLIRDDGLWHIRGGEDEFVFERQAKDGWAQAARLGAWLAEKRLRLAPRALTLTSFLRLVVIDQFVHGIGGALYDQVTDRILASFYGQQPPAFSVATATMYLPQAQGRERTCVECLLAEQRRLRHGVLGGRKMELVRQIANAPRGSSERSLRFAQMHRELDDAMRHDERIAHHQASYEQARRAHEMDLVLFDRELPYTLQSRQRLEMMVAQVAAAFA